MIMKGECNVPNYFYNTFHTNRLLLIFFLFNKKSNYTNKQLFYVAICSEEKAMVLYENDGQLVI